MPAQTLICTVGTSLLGNLGRLGDQHPDLAALYQQGNNEAVADYLNKIGPEDRLCGAEINSCARAIGQHLVQEHCTLIFVHSATPDGRRVAAILTRFFQNRGHGCEMVEIDGLQDENPGQFRSRGLPALANAICGKLNENGLEQCALNATGGYKAQMAVAVLIGQALGVPVYYMHEKFKEIISFPPMPVSLDMELWMANSALFYILAADRHDTVLANRLRDYDFGPLQRQGLIDIERIDQAEYVSLTATGVIFHQTNLRRKQKFGGLEPPDVAIADKREPIFATGEAHAARYRPELENWMQRVTKEIPAVRQCKMHYFNPDLPMERGFRITRDTVEGIYSDGTFTAKFEVYSSAENAGQRSALVARLNEWAGRRR